MKILFVCLGNICRSPCAHGIFLSLDKQKKYHVDSCGTNGFHDGENIDPRMKKEMIARNTSFSHTSRQITKKDIKDFDLILCMESKVLSTVRMFSDSVDYHKILSFRDFDPAGKGDVPDPYYTNTFSEVYDIIKRTSLKLYEHLENKKHSN